MKMGCARQWANQNMTTLIFEFESVRQQSPSTSRQLKIKPQKSVFSIRFKHGDNLYDQK